MNWKKSLRSLKTIFFVDPNSAEGYEERAKILMENGVPADNPLVTAYQKIAATKRNEKA